MFLRISEEPARKMIGHSLEMSMTENRTAELWQKLMPHRAQIETLNSLLFSLEEYPADFFTSFNPTKAFRKWAAVEVRGNAADLQTFESLEIPAGTYAVFLHKGPASAGPKTYAYIFNEWLPQSGYNLDNRPHMAIMGEKYKHDSPDSEEEIFIPIV